MSRPNRTSEGGDSPPVGSSHPRTVLSLSTSLLSSPIPTTPVRTLHRLLLVRARAGRASGGPPRTFPVPAAGAAVRFRPGPVLGSLRPGPGLGLREPPDGPIGPGCPPAGLRSLPAHSTPRTGPVPPLGDGPGPVRTPLREASRARPRPRVHDGKGNPATRLGSTPTATRTLRSGQRSPVAGVPVACIGPRYVPPRFPSSRLLPVCRTKPRGLVEHVRFGLSFIILFKCDDASEFWKGPVPDFPSGKSRELAGS